MIIFEKIKFKNAMSYGQNWTEFEFRTGINKLSGLTGNGKSSIAELIYFTLFGKPYRNIVLGKLINSINGKELECNLWFSINSDSYRIER